LRRAATLKWRSWWPGVQQVSTEVVSPDAFGPREQASKLHEAGVAPRSSARDMETTASVKLRLFGAKDVPSMEISVDTEDGVVTLFGIVPTTATRESAGLEASRSLDGVPPRPFGWGAGATVGYQFVVLPNFALQLGAGVGFVDAGAGLQ
jgi:hypothetical protein